jgi:hypothetical protein
MRRLVRPAVICTIAASIVAAQQDARARSEVPEEIAYRLLFLVIRPSPPPHWNHLTIIQYLANVGFSRKDADVLIRAAERYFLLADPIQAEIKAINDRFKGANQSPEAGAQLRPFYQRLQEVMRIIRVELNGALTPAGQDRLAAHIQTIRSTARTRVAGQTPQEPNHAEQ